MLFLAPFGLLICGLAVFVFESFRSTAQGRRAGVRVLADLGRHKAVERGCGMVLKLREGL